MNTRTPLRANGFTLIELLVAITIMLFMVGGGVASYLRLDQRQNVVNAGKEVHLLMRSAQKKARVGDKPASCDTLQGYKVQKTAVSPDTLTLFAVCSGSDISVQTYSMPNGVTLSSFSTMTFRGLHGGVENPGDVSIVSQSPAYTYTFTVNSGGYISEGTITTGNSANR